MTIIRSNSISGINSITAQASSLAFYDSTGSLLSVDTGNVNAGVLTATTVRVTGDLTVEGTTTTLDTVVTEVDKLEVNANNSTVGVAITQSGTGDILRLYDGATEVFSVIDGGKVGINKENPSAALSAYHATNNTVGIFESGDSVARVTFLDPGGQAHVGNEGDDLVLAVTSAASEALRISSDGKVTITSGTNTGSANAGSDNLVIKDSDGSGISILSGDGNSANVFLGSQSDEEIARLEGFYNGGSPYFAAHTGGSERLRIDQNGNIGIGTDNPGSFSSGAYNLVISSPSGSNSGITINSDPAGTDIGSIFFSHGTSANAQGRIRYDHSNDSMQFYTNGSTERLRITSDGDIRGSLLDSDSGVNVYPEFYRRITGFQSGNSVVNYLLLCTASQPQVRLTGRFLTARSPGTSACAAQLFDISFQTNHDGTHTSGAIMGLHSGSNGFGHAEAELVQLTYNSTNYYAIRFSTGWTTDFDSCYFDGIASDNVLFTHISNISETITGITVFSADTNKGDVTIQQADLRISDGDIIMASGHGISFSAASGSAAGSTSAVLDDYEEGTFTPRISVEGQSDAAIDNVSGTYVKVGQLVHCTFNADLNGIPAGRGTSFAWQWGGLPFTSLAEGSDGSEDYVGSARIGSADHTSTYGVATFILRLFDNATGGRVEAMRVSNGDIVNASLYMKDNTSCNGSITYRVI